MRAVLLLHRKHLSCQIRLLAVSQSLDRFSEPEDSFCFTYEFRLLIQLIEPFNIFFSNEGGWISVWTGGQI